MAISKVEKERVKRIKAEYEKIKESFEKLPEVNMNVVEGLIERAAFMRIMLEDMEKDLVAKGVIEEFTQSEKTEPYERQRPTTQIYNSMNANYQKIIKELTSHLPVEYQEKSDSPEDIMNNFIRRREAG